MSFPVKVINEFAGQNWLITPAALAVNEAPPRDVHEQKWLLTLSGVGTVNLEGSPTGAWQHETVILEPTVVDPMHYAIAHHSIPVPAGTEGKQYSLAFEVEQLAPFASVSSMFNAGESINSGFAVNTWRPNHWGSGIDSFTHNYVSTLFTGLQVDLGVRDTDAWIYGVGYTIALLGNIVFIAEQESLFRSLFTWFEEGLPPSHNQEVGTATFEGQVTVVSPPVPSSGDWVQVGKRSDEVGSSLYCVLAEAPGPGVYLFTAELFLTDASGIASISFVTAVEEEEFMHVDFMPNNTVRVDDVGVEFGSFPRNAGFIVQVALNLQASGSTATVALTGAASGAQDVTVKGPFQQWSQQFAQVRLWQGFGDTGGFQTTSIVVTRARD